MAAVVIGGAAYLGFGWDWLHAFGLAGENQGRTSYMSIPITVARLTGLDPDAVRVGALTLFLTLFFQLLLWTWRGFDWVRAAGWTALGLLLATSWLLPWYLDLAPSPGRDLPRPPPPAPGPRPDCLPAGSPHPALSARLEDFGRVAAALWPGLLLLRRGMQDAGGDAPALAATEQGDRADVDEFADRHHAADGDRDQRAEREAPARRRALTAQAKAASRTPSPAGATSVTSAAK